MADYDKELADIAAKYFEGATVNQDREYTTKVEMIDAMFTELSDLLRRVEVDGFSKGATTELRALQDLYKNEIKFTHRDEAELRSWTQYRLKMSATPPQPNKKED